jgi:hypothetical protein
VAHPDEDRQNRQADQDQPPSREGLSDAQAWVWDGDHWQVRRIGLLEEGNEGGSPSPGGD